MSTPVNQGQGGGDASPTPFTIPTDPDDLDAGLWRLVGCFISVNQSRRELSALIDMLRAQRKDAEADTLESEKYNDLYEIATDIEISLFATPARTTQGFMVKLLLAFNWTLEDLPPTEPMGHEWFLLDPLDGGSSFDERAMISAWQDAVALFGLSPVIDPTWERLGGQQS